MHPLIEELVRVRKEKRIKQSDVSHKVNIPQSHLSAIEHGRVDPRLSSFVEMAAALGLIPMLIPKELYYDVRGLLRGDDPNQPRNLLEDME